MVYLVFPLAENALDEEFCELLFRLQGMWQTKNLQFLASLMKSLPILPSAN